MDAETIGKSLNAFCQIRMKTHDPATRQDFEAFIRNQKEVLDCYSIPGDWDYLIHAVVGDVAEHQGMLMRGMLTHEAVLTSSSHFALKTVKYTTALPV